MNEDKMIAECLTGSGYKTIPFLVRKKQYRTFFCKNCGQEVEGYFRSDKIYCDDCSINRRNEIIAEISQTRKNNFF